MKTMHAFLIAVLLAPPAALHAADAPSPYATAGVFKVETVSSVALRDNKREKTLDTLIRYPVGQGPFPVIIFSHGAMANKDAFAAASEHWASHGYIVIHPNHADASAGFGSQRGSRAGTNTAPTGVAAPRSAAQPGAARGAGMRGLLGGAGRIERIKDITSVLDAFAQIENQIPALTGKLNRAAIGVAGHSFGAYVAQCQGGVKTLVDGKLTNLSDPRVKAVVPISAQGESSSYGLVAESWNEARTPAMHITGTRDTAAPGKSGGPMGDVATKKVPFERSPAGGKYLLVIEGANHLSFGGKFGRLSGGADAAQITKVASLAFFDAFLRHDPKAKDWLDHGGLQSFMGKSATVQSKP